MIITTTNKKYILALCIDEWNLANRFGFSPQQAREFIASGKMGKYFESLNEAIWGNVAAITHGYDVLTDDEGQYKFINEFDNADEVVKQYFSRENFDVDEDTLQNFIDNTTITINPDDSEAGCEVIFELNIDNIKTCDIELLENILKPHQGNLKCHIEERLHDIYTNLC